MQKKVPLKFYFEALRGDVGAFFSFVEACYFRDRERLFFSVTWEMTGGAPVSSVAGDRRSMEGRLCLSHRYADAQ